MPGGFEKKLSVTWNTCEVIVSCLFVCFVMVHDSQGGRNKVLKTSPAYDEILAMEQEQENEREAIKRKWEPGFLHLGEGPLTNTRENFLGAVLRKRFKKAAEI